MSRRRPYGLLLGAYVWRDAQIRVLTFGKPMPWFEYFWNNEVASIQRRSTAPGFMMPTGSSAALIARIADSLVGSL